VDMEGWQTQCGISTGEELERNASIWLRRVGEHLLWRIICNLGGIILVLLCEYMGDSSDLFFNICLRNHECDANVKNPNNL
jgi:hypothetical protein